MADREKVMNGLGACSHTKCAYTDCPYYGVGCMAQIAKDARELLKAQEPRVITLEEVEALPYGYVLIETDKKDSLRWVDALLFCKNTNFSFDFITLEGHARLLGTDYNMEWRCWTARPTEEQRKMVKWE